MKKVEDWYYDLAFSLNNIKENIYSFFNGLRRWFAYRKLLMNIPDFDYSSILDVERFQMIRLRDSIIKYHNHTDWKIDVRNINTALNLLYIIKENGCSKRIGKDFEFKLSEKDGYYELIDDPESYYTIPVYINTRNSKRFCKMYNSEDFNNPKFGNLWKDNLRIEKAWYLYHKIKLYYLRNWWD